MKILICGVGAIGSNLARHLVPDLRGKHEITVLDRDVVEERNVEAGTQFFTPDQVGMSKVEALQYNVYKWYQREINIFHGDIKDIFTSIPGGYTVTLADFDLVVDCFDNQEARSFIQSKYKTLLHLGFSDQFTFSVEWAENYEVPAGEVEFDICELPGAGAFVASVASLGALVVEKFLEDGTKMDIVGGKFTHNIMK